MSEINTGTGSSISESMNTMKKDLEHILHIISCINNYRFKNKQRANHWRVLVHVIISFGIFVSGTMYLAGNWPDIAPIQRIIFFSGICIATFGLPSVMWVVGGRR